MSRDENGNPSLAGYTSSQSVTQLVRASFGGKAATSTCLRGVSDSSTRNALKLVLTVSESISSEIGASSSVAPMVESLVWVFVTRRSLVKGEWFPEKEFHRFRNSLLETAKRIAHFESDDNREQTFVKYWLNYHLCQVFGDPSLPPKDEWIDRPLFSGWLKRFVARCAANRDMSFFYSLQKGTKLIWPKLGQKKLDEALLKHQQRLGQPHGLVEEGLRYTIIDVACQVFESARGDRMTKFLPSGSACLQANRRQGGALSIFEPFHNPLQEKSSPPAIVLSGPERIIDNVSFVDGQIRHHYETVSLNPRVLVSNPVYDATIIGKLPVLAATLDEWRSREWTRALMESYDGLALLAPALQLGRTVLSSEDSATPPALDVEIQAIPEPGKFRIISKGDGYLYSALQPIQGEMLSAWKRNPSSTMRSNDLTDRIREIDRACGVELPYWCSIDYEAATDLMKMDATLAAFEGLRGHPLFQLGRSSLMGGRAIYPDGTTIPIVDAQLMGHPLSFPLLCTINLACLHHAVKLWRDQAPNRHERAIRKRLGSLMLRYNIVNGDDMLFKCRDPAFLDLFRSVAAEAGLRISVGKNYLSLHSCMINSQLFTKRGGKMVRKGYLNLKLVKGVSLKTGDSSAFPTQIGPDLSRMVQLCPWTSCTIPAAMERWRREDKQFHSYFRPNWYLPVHLGGYGVDVSLAPPDWRITRPQREMAAHFVSDPSLALFRKPGMKLPVAKVSGALARWEMVTGDYVPREFETQDVDDGWLARLAMAYRAEQNAPDVSDRVFLARLSRKFGLKPMSAEALIRYWNARLFAFLPTPCPPLRTLTVPEVEVAIEPMLEEFNLEMGFRSLLNQFSVKPKTVHFA